MNQHARPRFKFTPALALLAFEALVALPILIASCVYPHAGAKYNTITVRAHDTLWTLAAAHGAPGKDIQSELDAIIAANHLNNATLTPGKRLRIPQ